MTYGEIKWLVTVNLQNRSLDPWFRTLSLCPAGWRCCHFKAGGWRWRVAGLYRESSHWKYGKQCHKLILVIRQNYKLSHVMAYVGVLHFKNSFSKKKCSLHVTNIKRETEATLVSSNKTLIPHQFPSRSRWARSMKGNSTSARSEATRNIQNVLCDRGVHFPTQSSDWLYVIIELLTCIIVLLCSLALSLSLSLQPWQWEKIYISILKL